MLAQRDYRPVHAARFALNIDFLPVPIWLAFVTVLYRYLLLSFLTPPWFYGRVLPA